MKAQQREDNCIKEVFSCVCGSLNKVCSVRYYQPLKNEEKAEDVIYFSIMLSNWRTKVLPSPFTFSDLFRKKYHHYTPISKTYWKDYYTESIWKKIEIGLKHLIGLPREDSIFDVVVLDIEDCSRFLKVLNAYNYIKTTEEITEVNLEDEYSKFILKISVDDTREPDITYGIAFEIYFKTGKKHKKLKDSLRYLFNYKCDGYEDHFIIDKKTAPQIEKILKKITKHTSIN